MRVNLHQRLVRSSFEFVVRIEIASDTVEQQDNLTFIRETVLLTSGQARAERSARDCLKPFLSLQFCKNLPNSVRLPGISGSMRQIPM